MSDKMAMKKLVPKLRFPEFQDAGEWDEKHIGDYLNESRVLGSKGDIAKKITVKLWGKGVFAKDEATQGSENTQYYRRKAGQFIYSKLDFLNQAFGLVPVELDDFESTVDLPCFDIAEGLNSIFLLEYVKRADFYEKMGETADGSRKAKRIQVEIFQSFRLLVPTPDEQQKIADCLSTLDELITAQAQKLESLKSHKKGLMQQLFPAEGETTPKLRFPEFQDAGEWVNPTMGELFEFKGTNSFSRDQLNYEKGTVKNIHYGDIHTKFATHFDIQKEKVPFINPEESLDKVRTENYCKEGDLIFADASEDEEDIGKNIELVRLESTPLLSGLHTILARQKKDSLVLGFGGYLFKSALIRKQIKKESQGAKVLGISANRLSGISICLPVEKEEQQKIADCLSSLDELITAQAQKLESLKTHKKGLMQQLFPYLATQEAMP